MKQVLHESSDGDGSVQMMPRAWKCSWQNIPDREHCFEGRKRGVFLSTVSFGSMAF